jgi:putative ABC transport system ATP-binding protein
MKVELQHISKSYSQGSENNVALNDVSLLIPASQYVVVIGPNGSGKSTLLNVIAGATTCNEGRLLINDKDVTDNKQYEISRYVARVFQNPLAGTAPNLSIIENFRLAALRTQSKLFRNGITPQFKKEVQEKLQLLNLGLENKLNQTMGTLSGGQRQAITLLMATMDETHILLMDEPTAALDPKTSVTLMQLADKLIHEYKLTAILITHNLKDALHYGQRLLCMNKGRIVKDIALPEEKMNLQPADLYNWFEA